MPAWSARILRLGLWTVTIVIAIATAAEFGLRIRHARLDARDDSRFTKLVRAYEPFLTEQLHPTYLFSLPSHLASSVQGNPVCSLDEHGFREPGPSHAAGRTLAFLAGGSVAFGAFASSNQATIAAELNRLQSRYFFVSSGVPGFTSTQELQQLVTELQDYAPGLIVMLDGYNDASLAQEPERYARQVPLSAPENFPELQDLVARSRTNPWRLLSIGDLFPQLSAFLGRRLAVRDAEPAMAVPPQRIADAAALYVRNRAKMAAVAAGAGARFISIFQPVASLHQHVDRAFAPREQAMAAFHDAARAGAGDAVETYDLANMFDAAGTPVPVMRGALTDDVIFIDQCHLTDRGNALVARRIAALLGDPKQGRSDPESSVLR